jgi:hypothetical protein
LGVAFSVVRVVGFPRCGTAPVVAHTPLPRRRTDA